MNRTPPPAKRAGDWACSQCNYNNFARNAACRQCKSDKPAATAAPGSAAVPPPPLPVPRAVGPVLPETDPTGFHLLIDGKVHELAKVTDKETGAPLTWRQLYDMQEETVAETPKDKRHFQWRCKRCLFVSHVFTLDCNRCHRTRERPYGGRGDWTCRKCNGLIFASKDMCRKCKTHRDDWLCPTCKFYNFKTQTTACKNCTVAKPGELPEDGLVLC